MNKLNPKEIEEDLKEISEVATISDTAGGKILIKNLTTDIINSLNKLCENGDKMGINEFISISAFMKANMDLVRALSRSQNNKKFLEELLVKAITEQD